MPLMHLKTVVIYSKFHLGLRYYQENNTDCHDICHIKCLLHVSCKLKPLKLTKNVYKQNVL